jgi:hypothetical protein
VFLARLEVWRPGGGVEGVRQRWVVGSLARTQEGGEHAACFGEGSQGWPLMRSEESLVNDCFSEQLNFNSKNTWFL